MKNCGKIFEEDFARSFPKEAFIYRLRDNVGAWNGQGIGDNRDKGIRFTTTNICDFIAYSSKANKLLLLELKSFKGKSCPFSNLKKHQVEEMYIQGIKDGVEAYFILHFSNFSKTFGIKAELIYEFYKKSERKSFSYEWCKEQGVLIEGRLKRTRWEYEVEELLY